MKLVVEMPSDDISLRDELLKSFGHLSMEHGAAEQESFNGKKIVRISLEVAAVAGALAGTIKAADEIVKDTIEIVETLKPIFRKGYERYKKDPNADFIVFIGENVFLSSQMNEEDCKRILDTPV
jgi:hypothetical protein